MILQALKEYYDRKAADPDSDIASEGFEKKEIPFLVVIQSDGTFVSLEDTREKVGKKLAGKVFLLPRSQQRSGSKSYEKTFLLWDHIGYLFQYPESDEKTPKQHKTWLDSLNSLPDELKEDEGVVAVLNFYRSSSLDAVKADSNWNECTKIKSCNMTFRLTGDKIPVPCRSVIQEYIRTSTAEATNNIKEDKSCIIARCLVTGSIGEIARTHGRTPINKDTKSFVSFQKNSGYDSYGKEQGYNAPVCKSAEFAYTTALNTLLKSKISRMQIGDAATVVWAEKDSALETGIVDVLEGNIDIFGESLKDNPDRKVKEVRSLFESIRNGTLPADSENTRFYVLGLSPNKARISVRFWIVDTVAGMGRKIVQHFKDLRIVHCPRDKDTLSLFRLLVSTAVRGKSENIPPNLSGETMRAILGGLPYPQTLLQAVVRRNRAEQNVTYARASLLKACINRQTRFKNPQNKEELKMSLDTSNTNIGYRLGRLFATLEKIQTERYTQNGGKSPNSTIRDRFYGAASGTPVAVFSNLMRLKNHHLAKLENQGRRINFERLIAEIMDAVEDFPSHLPLADQGRFAIGYYHQNQDFYTKKENKSDTQQSTN